jgi:hypothetical protein
MVKDQTCIMYVPEKQTKNLQRRNAVSEDGKDNYADLLSSCKANFTLQVSFSK